ncbi:MAG TPA: hypothetical protein VHA14_10680, partial [Bryobacteraceae bacterium]|nr:hypothetical protein [Bryobacteraceae bacterium]
STPTSQAKACSSPAGPNSPLPVRPVFEPAAGLPACAGVPIIYTSGTPPNCPHRLPAYPWPD